MVWFCIQSLYFSFVFQLNSLLKYHWIEFSSKTIKLEFRGEVLFPYYKQSFCFNYSNCIQTFWVFDFKLNLIQINLCFNNIILLFGLNVIIFIPIFYLFFQLMSNKVIKCFFFCQIPYICLSDISYLIWISMISMISCISIEPIKALNCFLDLNFFPSIEP